MQALERERSMWAEASGQRDVKIARLEQALVELTQFAVNTERQMEIRGFLQTMERLRLARPSPPKEQP